MNEGVRNKIIEILRTSGKLDAVKISEELGLTYDTTSTYLRLMTRSGRILRRAEGKPWRHYYNLSEN
jgi:predicted transcriptional regulator